MPATPRPPEHTVNNAANPGDDDKALRAALRREKLAARAALPAAEHARLSALLEGHLERELGARTPGVVAFCWPIRGEFDARPLVCRLLACGWRAAVPTVIAIDQPMVFRPWAPESAMAVDPYGIPVPAGNAVSAAPDLVLLPLAAFDDNGYRLGYGGGYFDRTLAGMAPCPETIGVAFELARVATTRPQKHDISMGAVVTECGFRRFATGRRELR